MFYFGRMVHAAAEAQLQLGYDMQRIDMRVRRHDLSMTMSDRIRRQKGGLRNEVK